MRRLGKPFRVLGSALMRGDQLVSMIRPHLTSNLRTRVAPFHAGLMPPVALKAFAMTVPEGSVLVFVKSAAKDLTPEHLEMFRKRKVRIGLDVIDWPLDSIDFNLFDFLIAASLAGKSALEARLAAIDLNIPVELLHHHSDPRIKAAINNGSQPFKCGYIGEPPNALIPTTIAREIDCIDVTFVRDFTRSLGRIGDYALHYGVRPLPAPTSPALRQYKPFTKGFTAAACGANILVNREADDAVTLLGDDYPFLVSTSDPDSIVAGFDHAKSSFGGPVWREGLDRMQALKKLVAPKALASRVQEIVDNVSA